MPLFSHMIFVAEKFDNPSAVINDGYLNKHGSVDLNSLGKLSTTQFLSPKLLCSK